MARYLITLLIGLMAGCQTAKDSYKSATKAEAEGRWAAAADWYIDALRRDSNYPGARDGLANAGKKAITGFMKAARNLETSRRYEQATAEYTRTDRLVSRAAGVGVTLQAPSGYAKRRRATYDRAIEQALVAADRLAAEGRWRAAEEAYRKAGERFSPSAAQRERARAGRIDALIAGATGRLNAGQYDEALTLANRAANLAGPGTTRRRDADALRDRIADARYAGLLAAAEESMNAGRYQEAFRRVEDALAARDSVNARALRDRIVELGTVTFVPLPVWRRDRIARFVPATLLTRMNDALRQEYWDRPPVLLATPGATEIRRELRRLEFDREILSNRRAAAVGARLNGALTVVPYLDRCAFLADGVGETRRVATRDGAGANILVFRRRTLRARCVYRIVRVDDGRTIAEGAVEASAARRVRHASYDGDIRNLLMTREENSWFNERRLLRVDRELEEETATRLAEGVAEAVYGELARLIP